ncbi:MAG TPA: hypothetical protein VNK41_04300 [Vicinamibacterales bacterium]|nr:hypothetical protein [Vicinamibacterales bacterium]
MARNRRRTLALAIGAALAVSLAIGIGTAAAGKRSGAAASPLRQACGPKLVVQTDWFPEPEHGFIYQLAGTNGTLDTKKGRYTGTIKGTGVQLEIRAGGPFTGFQQPISQIYQDSSIDVAYATSDEQIQLAKKLPLVSIVAPDEFSPQILMWNPQKLNIKKFADIKGTGAKVLVFAGGAWIDYLVGRGWVDQKQVDTSYDGSPARFVASDGAIIQQGFVTSEPYLYEHDIAAYGKPVSYLLIKNSGYVPYPQTLAVRAADVRKRAACWKLFVPLVQRAQVDYMRSPKAVNDKLLQIVTALNTFWKLTPGGNAYNTAAQRRLGIVSNGPDCTLGNFSMKRLQQVINQVNPIFQAKGLDTINPELKASQIATNQFIDPKIGLAKKGCQKR